MSTAKTSIVSAFEDDQLSASRIIEGRVRTIEGTIALLETDIDGTDVILLAPVPTAAAITSILIFNDALGDDTMTYNVGLYNLNGSEKDDTVYASEATDLNAAQGAGVEVAFQNRNINTMGQRVWEDAGDASDPGGHYYLAITVGDEATTPAAGDMSFAVEYQIT